MILDSIVAGTRARAAERAVSRPARELETLVEALGPTRDFRAALERPGKLNLIAEIKRASPSAGMIRPDLDPAALARDYESAGAAALSVLTESAYFLGGPGDLAAASGACAVPVLQKDFILTPWQVLEARAEGADAILLIVSILDRAALRSLHSLAGGLGLAALVEVHDEREAETALDCGARIIGINNRNLKTMETDISTTRRLLPLIPGDRVIVSESGLRKRADILALAGDGINAFLVGERLLDDPDPAAALRELLGTG